MSFRLVRARVSATVVAVLSVLALLPGSAEAARAPEAGVAPVVLVGTSGVRWDDVTPGDTPALWSLLTDGGVGAVAVRSVRRSACPVDGWLAVSAARRAGDVPPTSPGPRCRQPADPVDGEVPRWEAYTDAAAAGSFEARPGLLGDALAAARVQATAVGPGAAIALATSRGTLESSYLPWPADAEHVDAALGPALAAGDLVVVDVGAVHEPADLLPADPPPTDLPPTDPDLSAEERQGQVRRIDSRVATVLDHAPASATVLVASLGDSGADPRLQLIAGRGRGAGGEPYTGRLLGSRSTRQDGLVQVTDLTPTLLALLGVDPPAGLVGAPIGPVGRSASAEVQLAAALDLDAAAQAQRAMAPPFFNLLVAAQVALYGAATLALRRRWGGPARRHTVLAWLRRVSVVFAAVPVSTFLANLVPWWRADNDFLAVVASVAVGTALVSALALLGPWRHHALGPLAVVAGATAGVLAVDVVTGSHLLLSSLMGHQPLVAGRFYGLSNAQFALFGTGMVLLATTLADLALGRGHRPLAVAAVVGVGLVAVVVDGTPGLGSDGGGPPAMVPAFAVLALLVGGVRVTWARLAAIGVGTFAVVAVLAVLDWLRAPDERTHLGRFVETLAAGGALPVVQRKLHQNVGILFGSYLSALVPIAALFIGVILMRPDAWGAPVLQRTYERHPVLRHGLVALIVMLTIGFAVNDSGATVPPVASTLAIPLLIAAGGRVLEDEDRAPSAPPAGAERVGAPPP